LTAASGVNATASSAGASVWVSIVASAMVVILSIRRRWSALVARSGSS
jgi:hypothetical protein